MILFSQGYTIFSRTRHCISLSVSPGSSGRWLAFPFILCDTPYLFVALIPVYLSGNLVPEMGALGSTLHLPQYSLDILELPNAEANTPCLSFLSGSPPHSLDA